MPCVEQMRVVHGDHYGDRVKVFCSQIPKIPKGATIFLGASIVERFPLEAAGYKSNVVNFGIAGDRIDGVRDRLDLCVRAIQPSEIYIMVGTNDVLQPDADPVNIARVYTLMLTEIQEMAPEAAIVAVQILPFGKKYEQKNDLVCQVNQRIIEQNKNLGIRFLDLQSELAPSGVLRSEYTLDDIHLTLPGYYVWLKSMLDRDACFTAFNNLSSLWKDAYRKEVQCHAVNPDDCSGYPGGRGVNQLICYTPECGRERTGTNSWGKEAIVIDQVVCAVQDGNSRIPPNGYVVSGHGDSAQWIVMNLHAGTRLVSSGLDLHIQSPPVELKLSEEYMKSLEKQMYSMLGRLKQNSEVQSRARACLYALWDMAESRSYSEEAMQKIYNEFLKISLLREKIDSLSRRLW